MSKSFLAYLGRRLPLSLYFGLYIALIFACHLAHGFEGRITATLMRGGQSESLIYTVGTNQLRLERGEGDRPYPKNILQRDTGDLTLLFPNNRSFIRLEAKAENSSTTPPGFPALPASPSGIRPQTPPPSVSLSSGRVGPTNLPGLPATPAMPLPPAGLPPGVGPQAGGIGNGASPAVPGAGALPMPMMPPMKTEPLALTATGDRTNLLGYACERFEIKQRGEVMEIWATTQLLPFQPYVPNQPHRFGPRMIEEQWGGLLQTKKLFPLHAVLKFENGPERLRFEVQSVKPEKIADPDGALFQPPPDYHELQPLPF